MCNCVGIGVGRPGDLVEQLSRYRADRDQATGIGVLGDDGRAVLLHLGDGKSRVAAVLHRHPKVAKAAVIGLPDERWGEAVMAVVVPVGADPPSGRELIDVCRERLAGFETPKRVIFADSLPETVGGKVLKYKLRQQYR